MAARKRQQARFAATVEDIKAAARDQMAQQGTAGLSIRGIARTLGLTPPAIYHYFPSLEELITALIVDDFNSHADALIAARDAVPEAAPVDRLRAVLLAYRQWAVDHPVDFNLIYGQPIPGYAAPPEITTPAAARSLHIIVALVDDLLASGVGQPRPPYDHVPAQFTPAIDAIRTRDGTGSRLGVYLAVIGWGQIHGMIVLELTHHLPLVIGDADAFYAAQVETLLLTMGLTASYSPHA